MELSLEKVSARLQPATAGHARLVLSKTVPFFCTSLYNSRVSYSIGRDRLGGLGWGLGTGSRDGRTADGCEMECKYVWEWELVSCSKLELAAATRRTDKPMALGELRLTS